MGTWDTNLQLFRETTMADDTRETGTSSSPTGTTPAPVKRFPKNIILGKDGKPCKTCNSLRDMTSLSKNLHSIAATYPTKPTPTEQSQVSQFMGLFSKLYPCWVCAEDFQDWMAKNKVRTESREEFGQWMCEAHNDVNKKLGKKEFDCSKWEERWRTGWKDGRCD